jgi:esterase/lipase superfamily enzyme
MRAFVFAITLALLASPVLALNLQMKAPLLSPQMTWGRTLENALKSKGISKDLDEWIAIAMDRSKWRQLTHSIPKPPDA